MSASIDIGWYASAYNLACASIQPLSGTIYRKFNTKNIFLGFFAIFQLGSLLCGIANSSMMLVSGEFTITLAIQVTPQVRISRAQY